MGCKVCSNTLSSRLTVLFSTINRGVCSLRRQQTLSDGKCQSKRGISMANPSAAKLIAFGLVLIVCGGCTAPIAMQGLGSSSPVAFSYIGRGRGDSAWIARYEDVVQATLRAGKALSLILEKEEIGAERTVFHYIDGKDKELDILIERRTETVTYARFNVGWFGSRVLGRRMVRQIVFEFRHLCLHYSSNNPSTSIPTYTHTRNANNSSITHFICTHPSLPSRLPPRPRNSRRTAPPA